MASTSSTTTSALPSSGDIAACKTYGRVEKTVNPSLQDLRLPAGVVGDFFRRWADDLETGTLTATNPELVETLKGTANGLRATGNTASADPQAWGDGKVDLLPDLKVVYEQSQKVADACTVADPAATYVAMVNRG